MCFTCICFAFAGKTGEADQDTDTAGVDLASQQSVSAGTSVVTSSDLNSAAHGKEALEKLLSGTMSEEESMQLAMVLAQSLHSDAELGRHARLLAEAGGVATTDDGLGVAGITGIDGAIFGGGGNVTGGNAGITIGDGGEVGGVLSSSSLGVPVGVYGGMDPASIVVGEIGVAAGNVGGPTRTGSVVEGNYIMPPSSVAPGQQQQALMTPHQEKAVNSGSLAGLALPSSSQVLGAGLSVGVTVENTGASKAGVGQNRIMPPHQNMQLPVTGPPAYFSSSTLISKSSGGQDLLKTGSASQSLQQTSHVQQQQLQLQHRQQQQRLQQQQAHLQRLQQRQLLQQQKLASQTSPALLSSGGEGTDTVPSILTADLNTVYGQIENLSRFQMGTQKAQSLGLNHVAAGGLDPFTSSPSSASVTTTTAKTVIRHLPTDTVSPPSCVSFVANTSASPQISLSSSAVGQRSKPSCIGGSLPQALHSKTAMSSPPNVCLQQQPSRVAVNPGSQQHQNVVSSLVLQQPLNAAAISSTSITTTGLVVDSALTSSSSVSSAKLSKLSSTQAQLNSSQSHVLKMQQQHHLQQLQIRQQLQQQQEVRTSPATVRYMLQVASSASASSSTSPSPLSTRAKLILPDKAGKSPEIVLRGASPKPIGLPKFSPGAHRLNLNSSSYQEGPKQSNFPPRPAQTNDASSRLKLTSSGTKLLDSNTNKISLTKSFNSSTTSSSPSPPSFSSSKSSPKPSGFVQLLPGGTSASPSSSTSSPSPLVSTTFRPHNLLDGADSATTELISVTVRQPSSMESVPSTVRHTLPDVCPTAMTLPSTPPLQLPSSLSHQQTLSGTSSSPASLQPPQSSSSSSSPSRTTSQTIPSSTASLSTPRKLSGRQQSVASSPMQQHASLRGPAALSQASLTPGAMSTSVSSQLAVQNGLQFVSSTPSAGSLVGIGSRAAQVVNKFQGNKGAKAKNKGNNVAAAAAEAARLSALASAAGVPVVCNPVSLPGFAPGQGLSTTIFKSSGSS